MKLKAHQGNEFGDEGAAGIAEALKANKSLTDLNLERKT